MSEWDSIRSTVEAVDAVVRSYSEDIEVFQIAVNEKVTDIDSALGRLSTVWEGELQQNFDEKMKAKQQQIRAALRRAGDLKEKLDTVAAEFAAYLAMLSAAGNNE